MREDKVCDTCGDIGVEDALITCTKCKVGTEHLYCMIKVALVESADWCCEMCRSTCMTSLDCGLKKVASKDDTCNRSTKLPRDPKEFTDRKNFCKGARGNWHEKAVGKGKTKYLWTNEVKNMPSGTTKGEPTRAVLVSSKPSQSVASDYNTGRMKPKSIIHANSSYMVKSNPKFVLSQNNTLVQKVKELKSISTPVKEHHQMRQTSSVKDIVNSDAKKQKEMGETASASQMSRRRHTCDVPLKDATLSPAIHLTPTKVINRTDDHLQKKIGKESYAECQSPMSDATLFPAIHLTPTKVIKRTDDHLQKKIGKESYADCQSPMSGVKLTKDAKPKNLDAGNIAFTVKDFCVTAAAEESFPTDPATVASWIGSFILKDKKTSIGFQAHPTSQGLSKVIEFSKKMPEVLEFELCLYEDFLRTVFKGCDPDDQDIGLYFFPDDRIRPNAYISHLELLSGNFFLRGRIEGVELLVFTSKVLHKDYRKRKNCDFLWGLYRRRHGKVRGAVEGTMVVDMDIDSEVDMEVDTEVDMEVDMIGGEIVGPVDVVVPKQSNIDVPPGFSPSMREVPKQSVESNIDIPPGFNPSMRGHWKKKIKTEQLELA